MAWVKEDMEGKPAMEWACSKLTEAWAMVAWVGDMEWVEGKVAMEWACSKLMEANKVMEANKEAMIKDMVVATQVVEVAQIVVMAKAMAKGRHHTDGEGLVAMCGMHEAHLVS